MDLKAWLPEAIFTVGAWLHQHVVVMQEATVSAIEPYDPARHQDAVKLEGRLVPGFVDGQVYGASGRLFSLFPEAQTLHLMRRTFLESGTVAFQPTVATNTTAVFYQCIDAVRQYWKEGGEGVIGLHLEGPWLHPLRRGAHVEAFIHPPQMEEVEALLQYGKGVISTITLAPEQCSEAVLRRLHEESIVLSAGHSNASFEEAMKFFDMGIHAVTHLFNAMSPFHHRAPGLPAAAMMHSAVRASIIPDGLHVDYAVVSLAKKLMGERLYAITDAVTETGSGPYPHQLAGDHYQSEGVLSGSALSMWQAFRNLVERAGIEEDEALRMCTVYPAGVCRCERLYGTIAPGVRGPLVLLNKKGEVAELISGAE